MSPGRLISTADWPAFAQFDLLRQQCCHEGTGNGVLTFAGANGIADDADFLSRPRELSKAVAVGDAGVVVEPIAQPRCREQPRHAGSARQSTIEHPSGEAAETAMAIVRSSRDDNAV